MDAKSIQNEVPGHPWGPLWGAFGGPSGALGQDIANCLPESNFWAAKGVPFGTPFLWFIAF